MSAPQSFLDFDVAGADVTVWTFKKSGGAGGAAPTFTGRWVETDFALDEELKAAVSKVPGEVTETKPYGLLATNDGHSAMTIKVDETHAPLVTAEMGAPLPQRRVMDLKDLQNTDFYVIRLVAGGSVMLGVRKADTSWRTRQRGARIMAMLRDEKLVLEPEPQFSLSRDLDFIILDDEILILNKLNFESVLSYREAHANDFAALQADVGFQGLFTTTAPLVAYVGSNKLRLRRVNAVHDKGHFRDPDFMDRLRMHYAQAKLNIQFNGDLIDPTPDTCSDIITALLDHRLNSAFSQAVYDVPHAVKV